jgi:transposase
VIDAAQLNRLDAQQLREVVHSLMGQLSVQRTEIGRRDTQLALRDDEISQRDSEIARRERELAFKQATIDKLTHEMAVLKRLKFAAKSEAFNAEQRSLLEESLDADLEASSQELEQLNPSAPAERDPQQPKRQALPAHLPRREIHHEPQSSACACGCELQRIGQDVAEKLDYQPGVFTVERHIRGKWVCKHCYPHTSRRSA